MTKLIGFLVSVSLIAAIFLSPLAVIWSVNTLFNTSIAYSFSTWIATLVLGVYLRTGFSEVRANIVNMSK